MIVCEDCGCENVQTKMWVEVNTDKVKDGADSQGEDPQDNWCPNCGGHCILTTKIEFDKNNIEE